MKTQMSQLFSSHENCWHIKITTWLLLCQVLLVCIKATEKLSSCFSSLINTTLLNIPGSAKTNNVTITPAQAIVTVCTVYLVYQQSTSTTSYQPGPRQTPGDTGTSTKTVCSHDCPGLSYHPSVSSYIRPSAAAHISTDTLTERRWPTGCNMSSRSGVKYTCIVFTAENNSANQFSEHSNCTGAEAQKKYKAQKIQKAIYSATEKHI